MPNLQTDTRRQSPYEEALNAAKKELTTEDCDLLDAAVYCDVLCISDATDIEEIEQELERIRDEQLQGVYTCFDDYVDEMREQLIDDHDARDTALEDYFDTDALARDLAIEANYCEEYGSCYVFMW